MFFVNQICFVVAQELLDKCHPLGMFDSISTLAVASNMRELYRLVLVDTPLAPYFAESLTSGLIIFAPLHAHACSVMSICCTTLHLVSLSSLQQSPARGPVHCMDQCVSLHLESKKDSSVHVLSHSAFYLQVSTGSMLTGAASYSTPFSCVCVAIGRVQP